eukprot:5130633-Heterocapsa_arctica.AAC.1
MAMARGLPDGPAPTKTLMFDVDETFARVRGTLIVMRALCPARCPAADASADFGATQLLLECNIISSNIT